MKTVLIVGSPHPRGNSAAMAERFCAALGGGVRRFDAYTADVGPCTDCGRCGREAGCTIRDGAAELLYDEEQDGWYMGARVEDAGAVSAALAEAGAIIA